MPRRQAGKATQVQYADRIEFTAGLMGSMLHDFQVRQQLREKWPVSRRQCDRYMARARLLMRERSGRDRFEHLVEADAFYRSELQGTAEPMVRIKCRERLDALYGVDARYEGEVAKPAVTNNTVNVTINVVGLSVDEIERRIEDGAAIDPKQLDHLPRGDRLRILRKSAVLCEAPDA